jgi:integrase
LHCRRVFVGCGWGMGEAVEPARFAIASTRSLHDHQSRSGFFGTVAIFGSLAESLSSRDYTRLFVTTTNIMTRAVSSYLSWLHTEGHHPDRLRIKQLPNPTPIKVSLGEMRRIITFRPKSRNPSRTWTLLVLMLDTGLRLSEALTLERRHVDLNGRQSRLVSLKPAPTRLCRCP